MSAGAYDRERSLARDRCERLGLGAPRFASVDEVVGDLLAVQAQEPALSRWSLGSRLLATTDEEIRAALDAGSIVRTHVLRPTWHYVRAEDLRWLQALTGPLVRRMSANWYRNHGVDDAFLAASRERLQESLTGGRAKTRPELRSELTAAGLDVSGQRLAAALMDAELRAIICSGPLAGSQQTYALVEERLPTAPVMTEEEATASLIARYLAGHAPASLKDLRWWSSLTLSRLRAGVAALGDAVEHEVVNGVEYLYLTDGVPVGAGAEPPRFQLLQVFDELFVGYRETRGLIDPDGEYGAVLPLGFSKMMHVVLEDGRLVGRWRRDRRGAREGGGQVLSVRLTRPLTPADEAELRAAADRYGEFHSDSTTLILLA